MNKEIWKPVINFESYYEVSNFGNVKSLKRKVNYKSGIDYYKQEKILKRRLNNEGYFIVYFTIEGKITRFLVHRLVALHFILNINKYSIINHKDGNKQNCKTSNLEWTTSSLNQIHAYQTGLKRRKLTDIQKQEIIQLRKNGDTYMNIGKKYNISYQRVHQLCK